jgi:hypothetical protein
MEKSDSPNLSQESSVWIGEDLEIFGIHSHFGVEKMKFEKLCQASGELRHRVAMPPIEHKSLAALLTTA